MSSEQASKTININGINLKLPSGHPLDHIKSKFKRYDEFLPFLIKRLKVGSGIVDIGANCGDTLATIIPHGPHLCYIAAEPSENFFGYLKVNTDTINQLYPYATIVISNIAIGSDEGDYILSEKSGTAKLIKTLDSTLGAFKKLKLKTLIDSINIKFTPKLIKIDTDGSDYDVLNSSLDLIKEFKPILFFEFCPLDNEKFAGYWDALKNLEKTDYRFFYVFDNFGDFILATTDIKIVLTLGRYFISKPAKSPLYIDVLAVVSADAELADSAVNEFNQTPF